MPGWVVDRIPSPAEQEKVSIVWAIINSLLCPREVQEAVLLCKHTNGLSGD